MHMAFWRPTTSIEVMVGRSIAMCVHPYAVWRSRSVKGRALVFLAYAAVGYALTLGVLEFAAF
jgi:hypothetical protein